MPFHTHPARRRTGRTDVRKASIGDGPYGAELEAIFARTLLEAINQLKQHLSTGEVEAAIRTSIDDAVRALDAVFAELDVSALVDAMTSEIVKAGLEQVPILPNKSGIRFSFNTSDPRAIQWARKRAGQLIVQVGDETVTLVRGVTARLLNGEITLRAAKGEISRNVGLFEKWQKAVDNSYEETLQRLLDEGYDIDDAESMAAGVADKYSQRLVKVRASNIARTELATAQNQGRYLGWQQAAEQGLFDPDDVMKEWRTAPEFVSSKTEVCPICEPLDGLQAFIWDEFPDTGVLMPPIHPNCRCRAVLIVSPIEDVIARVEAARLEYNY